MRVIMRGEREEEREEERVEEREEDGPIEREALATDAPARALAPPSRRRR